VTASRLKPIVVVAGLAVAGLTGHGAAAAGTIGINFVGRVTYSNSVMDPAETAGVVAQANWNNATGGFGTLTGLVDEGGTATGAAVQWRSDARYLGIGNTPGNNRLMRGHVSPLINEPATVTVSGLDTLGPGDPYDVLVYFDAWNPTVDWVGTYTIGGHVRGGTDPAGVHFSGTFVEDTGSGGNYVRFRGLVGDAFTLTAESLADNGGSASINALQIYRAPEPAALALVAIGLAAARLPRRRP